MRERRALALALATALLLLGETTPAQPAADVVALNAPAFVVRGGVIHALEAGMSLESGDVVRTGTDARVLLRLAEGSDVRLGAEAEFSLRELGARPDGVFAGVLFVLRGAFRFTTTLLSGRHQRDLKVRIATVTAGIRGTDLWGRATAERDLVCLIEGTISVSHDFGPEFTMSDPLTFYVAPRGAPPQPVRPVDPAQLREWATETELVAGAGVMESGGPYSLHLLSSRDPAVAERVRRRLREAGYAAVVAEVEVSGARWHRVSLHGFTTGDEARALGARLAAELGLRDGWAQRTR